MIRFVLFVAALLLCAAPASLQAAPQFSGSLRNLSQLGESSQLYPDSSFLSSTTLRLGARATFASGLETEFALENLALYSQPPQLGQLAAGSQADSNLFDLDGSWEDRRWSDRLHVDRLSFSGRQGPLRWTAGRQAYGFGSILLFSPLDVIAPFAPTAIDTEYRPGIDALRLDVETSKGDQFGLLTAFGRDEQRNSYLVTGHLNRAGVDLELIGGSLRRRELVGLGLAGSLGGLGLKGEAAWYRGRDVGQPGGDLHREFPLAALELWYRFQNDLILLAEYLHNGAGSSSPADYLQSAASAAAQEGISPLLGQNYLLLAPSYELHPLITLSALYIRNLDDHSWLLRPQVSISLGDNLSLDISHSLNRGKGPEVGPLPGLLLPRSEFGLYGDNAALYLRYYF